MIIDFDNWNQRSARWPIAAVRSLVCYVILWICSIFNLIRLLHAVRFGLVIDFQSIRFDSIMTNYIP